MAGQKSNYYEPLILKNLFGNTAYVVPGTLYLALFTDTNTQAQRNAGTATEPSGNGYSRLAVTNNTTNWPAPTGSNPAQTANGVAFTLATPTPLGWGDLLAFGLYDAASAGNLLYWGDLLGVEEAFTADTTGLITSPAHGLVTHDRIKISSVAGGALPAGLTDGAYVYVLATGLTTDAFKVSATDGGAALTLTAAGSGKWGKDQRVTTNPNVAPTFAVGQLKIQEF